MTTDIPITYVNATGQSDFQVVVFTKNFSTNTPVTYYAAWEVLKGQSQVRFAYPVSMSVGATYQSGDQTIYAGPFPAPLGSTWDITQDFASSTATLTEGKFVIISYSPFMFTL